MKIFVYGTLQRRYHNNGVMIEAGGKFIDEGWTINKYPLFKNTIPFLHHIEGQGHQVSGEIFDVSEHRIGIVDRLEGHPNWYKRLPIQVTGSDDVIHDVQAYFVQKTIDADSSIMSYLIEAYNHEPIETYTWGGI